MGKVCVCRPKRVEIGGARGAAGVWRRRLLPWLVCLAFAPASVALADNSGGQTNVPNAGDYGNTTPEGNTVMIDSNAVDVYGGYTDVADAVVRNNRIIMTDGSIAEATGGRMEGDGAAMYNAVSISGGTVGAYVYGGYVDAEGDAMGNRVAVSGTDTVIGDSIYGGYVYTTGVSEANRVAVSDGVVVQKGNVYGSYVWQGQANDNAVTVSGSHVGSGNVIGGYTHDGTASGNIVVMSDSTVGRHVTGGYVYDGATDGNVVTVADSTVGEDVTGGYVVLSGDASDNRVTIAGNTVVGGDIYGGYVEHQSGNGTQGDAKGNIVTLATGAGADLSGSTVYGGRSNIAGADAVSGNVLNVDTSHVAVRNVVNFERINLDFNTGVLPGAGNAVLSLNDAGGDRFARYDDQRQWCVAGGRTDAGGGECRHACRKYGGVCDGRYHDPVGTGDAQTGDFPDA